MMVVDSSALIAILENEPEAESFLTHLRDSPRSVISAITAYETGIVVGARRGPDQAARVLQFLDELGIDVVPFAEPYISRALQAYWRYGKGIDPKARLNLGDCAAYALASALHAPLLYKGTDFAATDVLKVM